MSFFGVSLRNGVSLGLGTVPALSNPPLLYRLAPSLLLQFAGAETLDSRVTFTRTTTATRTNSSGVIESVAINGPRFDYNPTTLAPLGLLIEEQRTNLLLNSLIDGTSLSTQIVVTTAVSTTLSFYGTGQIVLSGSSSATVVGTGAYPSRTTLTFTPTVGALTLTVTGTVQYAQVEAGAFPTSYIPTVASQVTRTADNATMTGTNFSSWYNATEGTLYVNGTLVGGTTSTFPYMTALVGAAPNNDLIGVQWNAPAGVMSFIVRISGTQPAGISAGSAKSSGSSYKVAGRYGLNDVQAAFGGTLGTQDTAVTIPTITALSLGGAAGFQPGANTYLRQIAFYPRRLANAELQAITS